METQMFYCEMQDPALIDLACKEHSKEVNCADEEEPQEPGYEETGTGVFVHEEDAFDYAMERISQDEEEKRELVEWFYSGNWVKKG